MVSTKPQTASILFYDEETGQIKLCNVLRSKVQAVIDRGMSVPVPPEMPEHSDQPITDEIARQLGGMMLLLQGYANPELQDRLQIATEAPMNWTTPKPPTE